MAAKPPWLTVHPVTQEDSLVATALRAGVAAFKGKLAGTAARAPFGDVMERVAAPAGVTFEADTVGGIHGRRPKPPRRRKGAALVHVPRDGRHSGHPGAPSKLGGHTRQSGEAAAV